MVDRCGLSHRLLYREHSCRPPGTPPSDNEDHLLNNDEGIFFSDSLEQIDHWVAFLLLAYTGIRMIREGLQPDDEPCVGSRMLNVRNILTLSVATSIDALAVGLSFACLPTASLPSMLHTTAVIGFCSTALSICGLGAGIIIGRKINWHAEVIGGIVLILIGIKILIEHLT